MAADLNTALEALREHRSDLRKLGVLHAAVFGSAARGDAGPESDIDILVDLDPDHPIGLFEYARLKLSVGALFGGSADIVNRKTLKPLLREGILRDAIDAF